MAIKQSFHAKETRAKIREILARTASIEFYSVLFYFVTWGLDGFSINASQSFYIQETSAEFRSIFHLFFFFLLQKSPSEQRSADLTNE